MGRLREINVKAQFVFSPVSTLIATATASGSLNDDLSEEVKIEIYDPRLDSFDADAFALKAKSGATIDERLLVYQLLQLTADETDVLALHGAASL